MSDAASKMTKAKTRLVLNHPFFAVIALRLEYIESRHVPTMATDMVRVFWNPDFVDKLTVNEVAAVIMHECLHVAWLHGLRRGNRDPLLWNIACDFAINPVCLDAGAQLPMMGGTKEKPNYCYDAKYRDWSAPAIYEDLLKNAKKITFKIGGPPQEGDGQGEGQGQGQDDGQTPLWGEILDARGEDGKPLSEAERSELEEEIKIAVKSAAEQAKMRGKLPAGLEGLVEAVGKPKVNWRDYIQNWVSGKIPDNYTWTRPNRTMMANYGIYMPRMQLNGAGIGVLSVDTSGSVSDQELRDYVREIAGVIEICSPEKLYIIQHDAIVQRVDEWESGEDFSKLHIKGRGGTCIRPSFEYALNKIDEQIDWMICFTDMGIGDFPTAAEAPDFPVLWCATGPDIAPFGTYLPLKDAI